MTKLSDTQAIILSAAAQREDRIALPLPESLREIVAKHLNEAAVAQRGDVARLNSGLKDELIAKGMIFNDAPAAPFREALRKAGFYAEWKKKYGDEAWAILEKAVGTTLS